MDDPKWHISNTEALLPNCDIPKTDTDDPRREKHRNDNELPMTEASMALKRLPIVHKLNMEKELPRRQ